MKEVQLKNFKRGVLTLLDDSKLATQLREYYANVALTPDSTLVPVPYRMRNGIEGLWRTDFQFYWLDKLDTSAMMKARKRSGRL